MYLYVIYGIDTNKLFLLHKTRFILRGHVISNYVNRDNKCCILRKDQLLVCCRFWISMLNNIIIILWNNVKLKVWLLWNLIFNFLINHIVDTLAQIPVNDNSSIALHTINCLYVIIHIRFYLVFIYSETRL